MAEPTIYALASAPGRAGVSVMRISGPDAFIIAGGLMSSVPQARGVRRILDADGDLIDSALILRFEEGHSFTGEATIEIHCHGSIAIVTALSTRLEELGATPAGPGDFTRRALENGTLDLTQVEGLADLIDAETEAQRKQAVRVFNGALGRQADLWRSDLIRAGALIEATIDFVDEDVPVDVNPEVITLLTGVLRTLQQQIDGARAAEMVRTGFEVAIVGPPNIGKSTLLNRLAGRDAAITSEIAGTTRDVIEVRMNLGGLAVTLLDTAGVRETDDVVEQLGVTRAISRARDADLRVFLTEEGGDPPFSPEPGDLVLLGKADKTGGISGLTGAGVAEALDAITVELSRRSATAGLAIRERHRAAMILAVQFLTAAIDRVKGDGEADLIAEDIRLAVRALDSIVGRVDVEDLLGEIFSSFCIGK
ncbi:tRNA uridine-5-carboxymethylaminomethyl(34) synthesis GTPase MnmE [Salipiger sp. IMCC34102]|uniref:tRNA uridine-5-carboxymethylaminomethyl(34) synthesis GTPase MnmE n=1 Tax=Salipiger sp. IMCC34102 TaxID=2510647 RepID=UPI00101C8003|nr:tRNA uridine-5-carboxymethylaminomethyl(34) synthesis GTPase MnmE [Salipiger sp. IMCC34102]RYH04215.1 tRNA uridine-5-carboxymethylaminomethyl(34) synthesis GTPase MnmE [Salipiger sp. IMCC34102]